MKDLHGLTKEELIEIVQDYQEMTSEIEEVLSRHWNNSSSLIQDILEKYIYKL